MATLGRVGWAAVGVCALMVAGCAGEPEPRSLEGTNWRLVQVESNNDADGVTPVPEPAAYTVSFGEGGQATFELDCNTGTGTYDATPTGDGETGTLTFGTIAVTEMGCPPLSPDQPSLDQEVGAALPSVRGYRFIDDRLHMSLMFDGGILSWEPLQS